MQRMIARRSGPPKNKAMALGHPDGNGWQSPVFAGKLIWIRPDLTVAVRLSRTRSAPGETAVITCLTPRMHGFRVVLIWLSALVCMSGPGVAQVRVEALARELCERPPMGQQRVNQLKRRSDYVRLLEELADACPEVAMVFLDFEVGSIDDRAESLRVDAQQFIAPLHWPEPADRNY